MVRNKPEIVKSNVEIAIDVCSDYALHLYSFEPDATSDIDALGNVQMILLGLLDTLKLK